MNILLVGTTKPVANLDCNQNERRIKVIPKAEEQEWFSGIFVKVTKRKSKGQT